VPYGYRISKYAVTNAQYAEFLNAVAAADTYGLYNESMADPTGWAFGGIVRGGSSGSYTYGTIAGREDMPVNWVSFYDAVRFANWFHNGQPTGLQDGRTTEDGAYRIITESYPDGPLITRNADATIFLPTEHEWYKAAYYDAESAAYFDCPAGPDTPTTCSVPGATPNTANCGFPGIVGDLTEVGSYKGSASPYGTFDQGGNVWEWNEAIIGSNRGLWGWSFLHNFLPLYLAARFRYFYYPSFEYNDLGFRLASIPEATPTATPAVAPTPTPTPTVPPMPTPTPAALAPLDRDEQRCVNKINKAGQKVGLARLKENEQCLNDYQKESS
jgi:formylglycine-generating enzyme required for sulfatase activity